jgi:hypothetical protein
MFPTTSSHQDTELQTPLVTEAIIPQLTRTLAGYFYQAFSLLDSKFETGFGFGLSFLGEIDKWVSALGLKFRTFRCKFEIFH